MVFATPNHAILTQTKELILKSPKVRNKNYYEYGGGGVKNQAGVQKSS